MNRYRVFIVIGLAALVAGHLVSPLVVHAQDDESDGIRDQLRTMTKILEASIGNDSIDRRLTRSSIFESRIRTEYIPTVGAIFTIPITFPLHPSEDEKGNGTEDVVEEDLWEHFSSANKRASKPAAPDLAPVEPLNIHIKIEKDRIEDQARRLRREAKLYKTRLYAVADQDILVSLQDSGAFNFTIGGGKPYDPVKVTTLTRTIVETIAQYGHRLKSLPNSERVLVVLEAPRPLGSSISIRFTENDRSVSDALVPRTREIVKEKRKIIERERDKGLERSARSSGIRVPGTYWIPSVWGQGPGDHRLLAFKKSDLQQERSYDSMKSKVETTDY